MQTEPPKAEPPKRKRRWFQFSLRTLMIGVAASGATLLDLPASSAVFGAETQAQKTFDVWKYRLILPTYKTRQNSLGVLANKAGAPTDFGELYVDPASGHYVYQYWRENPLDDSPHDVPRDKLAGKPTDGKPLRYAYGFDGNRLWAAQFDGWANIMHAPAREHAMHSWQASTIESIEYADRDKSPTFMREWWKYAPIQRLFDQIGCKKWTRDEVLRALKATPDVKPVATTADVDELQVVTVWKLDADARMFAHVPKGFSTAWQSENHWQWAQLVAIDKNELGIDKCLISACGSSGGDTAPGPTRFEIIRDDKQRKLPAIFQPESYGDESTETVRFVADRDASR
jgi:hypothetical protein